jgi:hypothetical protein
MNMLGFPSSVHTAHIACYGQFLLCTICKPSFSPGLSQSQSASLSWNTALFCGLRPDVYYCQTFASLLMWGALSNERTRLSAWTAYKTLFLCCGAIVGSRWCYVFHCCVRNNRHGRRSKCHCSVVLQPLPGNGRLFCLHNSSIR